MKKTILISLLLASFGSAASTDMLSAWKDTSAKRAIIGTLQRYGYNVDRKSLSLVLLIVLQDLKARQQVAETMIRYLESPHLLAIDTAPPRGTGDA